MKEKLFNRNFTLLLLGQVCSLIGNYTLKFALSMYVLERTGSAAIFAGLLAVATMPQVLLAPIGGAARGPAEPEKHDGGAGCAFGNGGFSHIPWKRRIS